MKICLIYPIWQPSFYENEIGCHWPPIGIAYIAAYLRKHRHEVTLIERRSLIGKRYALSQDEMLNKLTIEKLQTIKPDYVGITATTPLILDAYETARVVKKYNKNISVIVGGCHPTALPETTLNECPEIDVVVIGEGELTMLDLVSGKPYKTINGIAYREANKIILTPRRGFHQNLDDFPFPARDLFDKNKYFQNDSYLIRGYLVKGTGILAARGCPFRCNFCQSGQLAVSGTGNYMRFHSPEYVIEQIQQLIKDFGLNGILFTEDLFSAKKENVSKICELMLKNKINNEIKWAANLRVDTVEKDLLDLMKGAGCVQVVYGCESGSQRTLNRMKKKTTVEKNHKAIQLAKQSGLEVEVNMIVGTPDETKDDFLETIDFLKKAKPHRVNRGKFYPLPGTPFYEELKQNGKLKDMKIWSDLWDLYVPNEHTFANITPNDFVKLQAKMDREVTYPINTVYHIKNNLKDNPLVSLRYIIFLILTVSVLHLPIWAQRAFRVFAVKLKIHSKLVTD